MLDNKLSDEMDEIDWACPVQVDEARALNSAAFLQVISDAFIDLETNLSNYHGRKNIRDEARHWLTSDAKDFALVCTFCGLDPTAVRERMRKFAAAGWPTKQKAAIMEAMRSQSKSAIKSRTYRERLDA